MKFKHLFALFMSCITFNLSAVKTLVGQEAPQFRSQALFPDGSIAEFNLKNYLGQNIVLYFYPMDNSPHCRIQAKKFRDHFEEFKKKNILVVGVSPDSMQSHQKFQKEYALPYPLVSDATRKHPISKKYNASGFLLGKRKTFLINTKGIIFKEFDQVNIEHQIQDILYCFELQQ